MGTSAVQCVLYLRMFLVLIPLQKFVGLRHPRGAAVPHLQRQRHPVPIRQKYLERALQMPTGLQLERAVPRRERDIVAMVDQSIGQSEDGAAVHVQEQRRVRRGEVDAAVGLGELLQFAADVRLTMAAQMLRNVESGEVQIAPRAGHVQAGELHDEPVAGVVPREPGPAIGRMGEVFGRQGGFVVFEPHLAL